jgi:hypothetical protein
MATSADAVWNAISTPGNLEPCHPFCKENPVSVWPGPDSRDEVHYLNGLVFERRFCRWLEGRGYDLEIGKKGGAVSLVSWRITAAGPSEAVLRITVYPHGLQDIPLAIRWAPYLFRVRPMLKQYLSCVVRGFEWYLLHGEPVPRNQWGTHPWFSVGGKRINESG